MKRLLLTGAHGFVAGSILQQSGPDLEVHAVSRGVPLLLREGICWHQIDPCDSDQLERCLLETRPEAVIHTAALADIDTCQKQQELARRVNVELTQTLARICASCGAKLVHCSTDTVFDGEHAPYREEHHPRPVNFYGETKVEAEKAVALSGAKFVIARLAIVVGLPVLGPGNSFLPRMLSALAAGREVGAPPDEIRTPLDVFTAGRALLELAKGAQTGIFHLAGNSSLSRFEMARRIAVRFGFSPDLIGAKSSATGTGRAPRPCDVSLDNRKARNELKTAMLDFDDALSWIRQAAPP